MFGRATITLGIGPHSSRLGVRCLQSGKVLFKRFQNYTIRASLNWPSSVGCCVYVAQVGCQMRPSDKLSRHL